MSYVGRYIAGSGAAPIETLTGNVGGPIPPLNGNINVIGAGAITVSGAGNTLTITSGAAAVFTWNVTTVDAGMVVDNGYIANKAGLLTMTLPATAAVGDILRITNMNTAAGWLIAQNANQSIRMGTATTTVGVAGSLAATALGDSLELVCNVAGASTRWLVISAIGNITVA